MRKNSNQTTSSKKQFKTVPLSEVPGFGEVLTGKKTAKQAASEQYCNDLGEFFGSIPGMKEVFSKGPLNQQDTEPDCENCESETLMALMECNSVMHRVGTLAALVQDLTLKQVVTPSRQRALAILEEIENLVTDGRNAIEEAGI